MLILEWCIYMMTIADWRRTGQIPPNSWFNGELDIMIVARNFILMLMLLAALVYTYYPT
jgi:hypothetical protein